MIKNFQQLHQSKVNWSFFPCILMWHATETEGETVPQMASVICGSTKAISTAAIKKYTHTKHICINVSTLSIWVYVHVVFRPRIFNAFALFFFGAFLVGFLVFTRNLHNIFQFYDGNEWRCNLCCWKGRGMGQWEKWDSKRRAFPLWWACQSSKLAKEKPKSGH